MTNTLRASGSKDHNNCVSVLCKASPQLCSLVYKSGGVGCKIKTLLIKKKLAGKLVLQFRNLAGYIAVVHCRKLLDLL